MPRKFILASSLEKIEERFHVHLSSYTKVLPASYNISGGDITYVVTCESSHELQAMQFGMTPYWAKKNMDLINARAEGDKNPINDPLYSGAFADLPKKGLYEAFTEPTMLGIC